MTARKVVAFFLGLALYIAAGITASAAAEPERILDFQSDISVHANGSMTVTETIQVVSAGSAIRRGIFHHLPRPFRKYRSRRLRRR